ncbi:hypothetical protein ACFVFF_36975 [Streptomyces sp. NPDC057680]
MHAKHPDALVSCVGSLAVLDLPYGQMKLDVDEPTTIDEPDTPEEQQSLF